MTPRQIRSDEQSRPRIVQCSREIADGGGVSGVAAQLEAGFLAAGYECDRVTLETVGLTPKQIHSSQAVNKLFLLRDVLWYTVFGTLYTRFRYSRRNTVIICHNDTLFGDIYVNHGLHKSAVLESPNRTKILLRNPLHYFLLLREEIRHRLRLHQWIVTLSANDTRDTVRLYPATRGRIVQLANGVHPAKFANAACRRIELREAIGVKEGEVVLLFVGHEFERKGLYLAIQALGHLDKRFQLWVVGGNESMVSAAAEFATRLGVAEQTQFFGTRKDGIEQFFGASDLFVLPSNYEATPLVMLEAMAAGVVPIMTPVGAAPDLIESGSNGFLVERSSQSIAAAIREATETSARLADMSKHAAETVQDLDWPQIVDHYIELIESIHASRRGRRKHSLGELSDVTRAAQSGPE